MFTTSLLLVHKLSTGWPAFNVLEIHKMNKASLERIVGGLVFDVAQLVQFFHALVVSGFGTDLTDSHNLAAGNADRVLEAIDVPILKECYVETDVSRVQLFVGDDLFEEAGEVFDVVHVVF